jgi:hypothetical protein
MVVVRISEIVPTGAKDQARRRPPVRCVAVCHGCGQEREGITRFESMSYGCKPIGRAIHFCAPCVAAIKERPLDAVLTELLDPG